LAISRYLQYSVFGPEETALLSSAYEEIICSVALVKIPSIVADSVARKVIAIGQTGERDKARIVAQVISELGLGNLHGDAELNRHHSV